MEVKLKFIVDNQSKMGYLFELIEMQERQVIANIEQSQGKLALTDK